MYNQFSEIGTNPNDWVWSTSQISLSDDCRGYASTFNSKRGVTYSQQFSLINGNLINADSYYNYVSNSSCSQTLEIKSVTSDIVLIVGQIETFYASFECASVIPACSGNEFELSWQFKSQSDDESDLKSVSVEALDFD